MKIKPKRSRRYINYGAIPTNEYTSTAMNPTAETDLTETEESAAMNPTAETNLTEKEESDSKQGSIAKQARFKRPMKRTRQ